MIKIAEFDNFHPAALMIYFIMVLIAIMFTFNPVIIIIALFSGIITCALINTKKQILSDIGFYIPLFILISVTNPLFSHKGETPLFFMNGRPVTLEAIIYGIILSCMIISVMLWCKILSRFFTSDKVICIFSGVIPKIGLIISMALRFIPLFILQFKSVSKSVKAMGLYSGTSYIDRLRNAARVFYAVISRSVEHAAQTGYSMNARGYNLKNHSKYKDYKIKAKDILLILFSILLNFILLLSVNNTQSFKFYPKLSLISFSAWSVSAFVSCVVLCFIPFFIILKGEFEWKYLMSKI